MKEGGEELITEAKREREREETRHLPKGDGNGEGALQERRLELNIDKSHKTL